MFEEIVNIVTLHHSNKKESSEFLEIDGDVRNYLLPTMPPHILQNVICDITKQTKMDEVNRTCYSYNTNLKSFVQQETSTFNDISLSPIIIEYFNNMIFLEMINMEELAEYLHINSECNYIALPIIHGYHKDEEKKTNAHISVIIFDNINKLAFHIDSNGWNETENFLKLENFIEQSVSMLDGFGLNYNYIRCEHWNQEKIYLNINYHHNELNDMGNCMIWTILMLKLMQETNLFPGQLFDKLEKLEYEEKIFVIKTYGDILLNKYAREMVEELQIKKIENPNYMKLFSDGEIA
jgi:hypothetical protein